MDFCLERDPPLTLKTKIFEELVLLGLPEIISVNYLSATLYSRLFAWKLIKAYILAAGKRDISLPKGSNQDLGDSCQRAASWQPVPIQWSANKEDQV